MENENLFTEEQANACEIVRLEKKMVGGKYESMIIGITDSDGNYYDWSDSSINENATKATIKKAILSYLTGSVVKKSAPVTTEFVDNSSKGLGETIG